MKSLLDDFGTYEKIMEDYEKTKEMSFDNYHINTPTILLPLLTQFNGNLKNNLNDIIKNINKSSNLTFNEITHDNINNESIQDNVLNFLKIKPDKSSYYYVIGELFSNIEDHSKYNHAYYSTCEYPNTGLIDLCIIDDGIGIPYSYSERPEYSDEYYIQEAVNGKSTKPEHIRGYGLRTTTNYVTSVTRGEILVVSQHGLYYRNNKIISKKTEYGYVNGTLVSVRFDSNHLNNLLNYLE